MSRHEQTHEELLEHAREHVAFIRSSAEAFDRGVHSEAKRIANSVRALVRDTRNTKSVLAQLGLKDLMFYDSAASLSSAQHQRAALVQDALGLARYRL